MSCFVKKSLKGLKKARCHSTFLVHGHDTGNAALTFHLCFHYFASLPLTKFQQDNLTMTANATKISRHRLHSIIVIIILCSIESNEAITYSYLPLLVCQNDSIVALWGYKFVQSGIKSPQQRVAKWKCRNSTSSDPKILGVNV
jgi:hypothetical protein